MSMLNGIEIFEIEPEANPQSVSALMSVKAREEAIFDAILDAFENSADSGGLTALSCGEVAGLRPQSCSTACSKLTAAGRLVRTQYVRRNSSGRDGRVLQLPGVRFEPRPGDKHSPEKVKPRAPKEIAATISLKAIVEELREENRAEDLRMLKLELQRIVSTI